MAQQFRPPLLGVHDHGAELVDPERMAVLAHPDLREQRGPAVVQPDHRGQDRHDRSEHDQRRRGRAPVEQVLEHQTEAGQLRVIYVQQGEPGRRPDRRPRTRDVEQGGRDAQVGTRLLELPGEAAEPDAVHFRAGGHRDGIRAEGLDRGRDVVQPAVDRDAGQFVALAGPHDARAHDGQPVVPVAPQLGDEIGDRQLMAHRYHAVHALAAHAPPVQPLAQGKPGQHVEHREAGQGDHHVGAGQLEVDRVGEDRDRRGQADSGVQHLAVLVRTGPDEPDVVGSGQPQGRDPEHRQRQAQRQVHGRDVAAETELSGHEHADDATA